MEVVKQLYESTRLLHQTLQNFPSKDDREVYIEKINSQLVQRESLIKALPQDYNIEEKQLGVEIIKLNETIDFLLNNFFSEIASDLRQVKQKKVAYNKYTQQIVNGDGMFFDKRK